MDIPVTILSGIMAQRSSSAVQHWVMGEPNP